MQPCSTPNLGHFLLELWLSLAADSREKLKKEHQFRIFLHFGTQFHYFWYRWTHFGMVWKCCSLRNLLLGGTFYTFQEFPHQRLHFGSSYRIKEWLRAPNAQGRYAATTQNGYSGEKASAHCPTCRNVCYLALFSNISALRPSSFWIARKSAVPATLEPWSIFC